MNFIYRKKYTCWICLEESDGLFSFAWTRHECGCSLQVHNKCLVRWLFATNLRVWNECGTSDFYRIRSLPELKRRLCYVVDGHRNFQSEVNLAETVQGIPAVGQTWAAFLCILEMAVRILLRIPPSEPPTDLWRGLPIEAVACPQCKKSITKGRLYWHTSSLGLHAYSIYKSASTYVATIALFWFLYSNPWKQWFKIGLYLLRQVFPESILQQILDVSTTRAIDVYTDSMNGIECVPARQRFLILGFPLYLAGLLSPTLPLGYMQQIYPWTLVTACRNSKVVLKVLSVELFVASLYTKVAAMLGRSLKKKLLSVRPYFNSPKDSTENNTFTEELLRTTWLDCITDITLLFRISTFISNNILQPIPIITRLILKLDPTVSPNECICVQNLLAIGAVCCGRELGRFFLAYKRSRELQQLQRIVEDDDI
ncbi:AFL152Wp [Eremothecium gossypii ATCC 10895]|uniref:AFL152Wp n=1 Tax=Eremothecium gossypii (strain ATCC 10895 / CBS 109.51 / FGSC 9923 / NRRL Y-1056) TaxID=284811 RepID=Q755H5_EREGS|nr:AFL152Wp [Eremothecium gossypii ATCC 10895]AAS53222.1 AFL152Wp [Eremothecium gossypii ATCC 10895]AEY97532.1 FAFL152Wp [Eremothecium gossypii FDAG1]